MIENEMRAIDFLKNHPDRPKSASSSDQDLWLSGGAPALMEEYAALKVRAAMESVVDEVKFGSLVNLAKPNYKDRLINLLRKMAK